MTAFAYVMMAVYPIGIPVIYTYWLFFRYGKELRLLRSLESEIGALKDELRASTSLSSARMRIRGAKSVWSSSELTKAQGANSSPIGYTKPLPEAVKKRVKMLQHEKEQLLGGLPDYVQKLVLGYGELVLGYWPAGNMNLHLPCPPTSPSAPVRVYQSFARTTSSSSSVGVSLRSSAFQFSFRLRAPCRSYYLGSWSASSPLERTCSIVRTWTIPTTISLSSAKCRSSLLFSLPLRSSMTRQQ